MGYARRMQEERERLQDIAATLLKETRFLVP
jgi:glycerol-3-phosphate dehydrogenase